jgi:hypothetical protein
VALEGSILADGHGLHTNLGISARYDHSEKEGWGFVHFLVGRSIVESNKLILLAGPQVGVVPHGKAAVGARCELAYRPIRDLRLGVFADANLASGSYSSTHAFAFVGWEF